MVKAAVSLRTAIDGVLPSVLSRTSFILSRDYRVAGYVASKLTGLARPVRIRAQQGGGGDGELKVPAKKKFITREEEPEQYWQTAGEREGENPMKTPLPYIIIFGMSTPFVILAIAFANGWIKVPVR